MNKIISIEEYIKNNSEPQIIAHKKSPLPSLLVLACGIVLIVLSNGLHSHDSLQMVVLTIGAISAITGAIMAALCFGKTSNYVYHPTNSHMKLHHCYVPNIYNQKIRESLASGNMDILKTIKHENSTNTRLDILISKDGAFALLQMQEFGTIFEPATPVAKIAGDEALKVQQWLQA